MLNVFCDGSVVDGPWGSKDRKHLPIHCYAGWVVKDANMEHVHHHALDLGEGPDRSGNFAEYLAVRSALHWLRQHHPQEHLNVFSDSQIIIRQLSGEYNCFKPNLIILRDAVRALAATFPAVTWTWHRREFNKEADVLSKSLLEFGYVPTWLEVQEKLAPKKRKARA